MPAVFQFSCGQYRVDMAMGEPPHSYSTLSSRARLSEQFELDGSGNPLFLTAALADAEEPLVAVAQRFDPGPESGFQPGILIVPETALLLVGAGLRLIAYDLQEARRLWLDEADFGFWGWRRHADIILMSAELELAAWDLHGRKLWTTFVEPPWQYEVRAGEVILDIMGNSSRFPIVSGPR